MSASTPVATGLLRAGLPLAMAPSAVPPYPHRLLICLIPPTPPIFQGVTTGTEIRSDRQSLDEQPPEAPRTAEAYGAELQQQNPNYPAHSHDDSPARATSATVSRAGRSVPPSRRAAPTRATARWGAGQRSGAAAQTGGVSRRSGYGGTAVGGGVIARGLSPRSNPVGSARGPRDCFGINRLTFGKSEKDHAS